MDKEEIFRDVLGYEGLYQVSSFGRVYNVKSGKFLKLSYDKDGYLRAQLTNNKKRKTCKVHRLVASAFIENPHNLPQVNHKDENKANNNVSNLEWCTAKYNANYGTARERMLQHPNYKAKVKRMSKQILQYTLDGKFLKEYASTREAERQTSIFHGNISACCRGKGYKSCGGFVWRFKDAS